MKPALAASLLLISWLSLNTEGSESHWTGPPDYRLTKTFEVMERPCSALDAKGVRHRSEKQKADMIWLRDLISAPAPDYSKGDRLVLHSSSAVFKLTLDSLTGSVQEVTIVKSSDYYTLDRCAVKALHRWRWKPGTWKEIELPMWMSAFN